MLALWRTATSPAHATQKQRQYESTQAGQKSSDGSGNKLISVGDRGGRSCQTLQELLAMLCLLRLLDGEP